MTRTRHNGHLVSAHFRSLCQFRVLKHTVRTFLPVEIPSRFFQVSDELSNLAWHVTILLAMKLASLKPYRQSGPGKYSSCHELLTDPNGRKIRAVYDGLERFL